MKKERSPYREAPLVEKSFRQAAKALQLSKKLQS